MMFGGRLKRREKGGEPAFGFTQLSYKEEEGKANLNYLSLVDNAWSK